MILKMFKKTKTHQPLQRASHYGKFSILIVFAAILSCVTVNVNFPESAVERAANDFVKDLYAKAGKKPGDQTVETAKDAGNIKNEVKKSSKKKKASDNPEVKPTTYYFEFFTSAYAQDLNTNTATASQIKGEMASRIGKIDSLKSSGVICETMTGKLRMRDASKTSDPAGAKAVMDQENASRDRLYSEIKAANPGVQEGVVIKYFSAAFRRSVPNGNCD